MPSWYYSKDRNGNPAHLVRDEFGWQWEWSMNPSNGIWFYQITSPFLMETFFNVKMEATIEGLNS